MRQDSGRIWSKKLTKQELVDSRFAIGFALWDHGWSDWDGSSLQDYISLQDGLSQVQEDLLADEKQVTSSMVQRMLTAIQKEGWNGARKTNQGFRCA